MIWMRMFPIGSCVLLYLYAWFQWCSLGSFVGGPCWRSYVIDRRLWLLPTGTTCGVCSLFPAWSGCELSTCCSSFPAAVPPSTAGGASSSGAIAQTKPLQLAFGYGVLSQQQRTNEDVGEFGELQNLIQKGCPDASLFQASKPWAWGWRVYSGQQYENVFASSRSLTVFIHFFTVLRNFQYVSSDSLDRYKDISVPSRSTSCREMTDVFILQLVRYRGYFYDFSLGFTKGSNSPHSLLSILFFSFFLSFLKQGLPMQDGLERKLLCLLYFRERQSLCSTSWPRMYYSTLSASWVLDYRHELLNFLEKAFNCFHVSVSAERRHFCIF